MRIRLNGKCALLILSVGLRLDACLQFMFMATKYKKLPKMLIYVWILFFCFSLLVNVAKVIQQE